MSSESPQKPVLVFIHVPKTGGSTTISYCESQCPPPMLWLPDFINPHHKSDTEKRLIDFLSRSKAERDSIHFITGHILSGVDCLLSRPCRYVTLLREPLRRIVSQYFHDKHDPTSPNHEAINNGELSLEDSLVNSKAASTDTLMRILGFNKLDSDVTANGSEAPYSWRWLEATQARKLDEMRAWFHTSRRQALNEQLAAGSSTATRILNQAKAKLRDQFFLVGTTERFDDFLFLLSVKMGWRLSLYTVRNKSKASQSTEEICAQLPRSVVKQFYKNNQAAVKLHAYAQRLFAKQWAELSWAKRYDAHCYRRIISLVRH